MELLDLSSLRSSYAADIDEKKVRNPTTIHWFLRLYFTPNFTCYGVRFATIAARKLQQSLFEQSFHGNFLITFVPYKEWKGSYEYLCRYYMVCTKRDEWH